MKKAYRASGTRGAGVTRNTPRAAALAFFEQFPDRRQCNIVQGETDGDFFTVRYGRASTGEWPETWKNVTRKNMPEEELKT
jgi:hypothetical protein